MREIKFRYWFEETKKMYYPEPDDFLRLRMAIAGKKYIAMQFTGRKDKNGKKIYEKDFIKGRTTDEFNYSNQKIGEIQSFSTKIVEWEREISGWKPFNYHRTDGINTCNDEFFEISSCEVIGNIYQNPELNPELLDKK